MNRDTPRSPGEVLLDAFLPSMGLSQNRLAEGCGRGGASCRRSAKTGYQPVCANEWV